MRENSKKKTLKFKTWNVRTLYQKRKLENVIQEINTIEIKILGVAEMRRNDCGLIKKNGYAVINSGNQKHFMYRIQPTRWFSG